MEDGERTYVEDGECASLAGFGVLLAQCDEFLGQSLGFLCFVP